MKIYSLLLGATLLGSSCKLQKNTTSSLSTSEKRQLTIDSFQVKRAADFSLIDTTRINTGSIIVTDIKYCHLKNDSGQYIALPISEHRVERRSEQIDKGLSISRQSSTDSSHLVKSEDIKSKISVKKSASLKTKAQDSWLWLILIGSITAIALIIKYKSPLISKFLTLLKYFK